MSKKEKKLEKTEAKKTPKRYAILVNKEEVLETSGYKSVITKIEELKKEKTPVIEFRDRKEDKTVLFTKINNSSNYKITSE